MIKITDVQQLYLDYWLLAQLTYFTGFQTRQSAGCPLLNIVCENIWNDILNAFITPQVGSMGYFEWQIHTNHIYNFFNSSPEERDIWN
jgi:hypothetical protein